MTSRVLPHESIIKYFDLISDINECDPQDAASSFTYTPDNCEQICDNVPGNRSLLSISVCLLLNLRTAGVTF